MKETDSNGKSTLGATGGMEPKPQIQYYKTSNSRTAHHQRAEALTALSRCGTRLLASATRRFDHTQSYLSDTQAPLRSLYARDEKPNVLVGQVLVFSAHNGPDQS